MESERGAEKPGFEPAVFEDRFVCVRANASEMHYRDFLRMCEFAANEFGGRFEVRHEQGGRRYSVRFYGVDSDLLNEAVRAFWRPTGELHTLNIMVEDRLEIVVRMYGVSLSFKTFLKLCLVIQESTDLGCFMEPMFLDTNENRVYSYYYCARFAGERPSLSAVKAGVSSFVDAHLDCETFGDVC